MTIPERCDLLVVGGGIHGAGIARDAAGRGLEVVLVEQYDLAAATSMSSSKLIHGGLRYLEQGRLRLVREALAEREILLRIAPHLVRPSSFLMPIGPGSRPAWQLRAGLWLYDRVAGHSSLPRSWSVDLAGHGAGVELRPEYRRGFGYSDAWGDDARLMIPNARSAADLGAVVSCRTRCVELEPSGQGWVAHLQREDGNVTTRAARAVVNATGPWVSDFLRDAAGIQPRSRVRLVKGSHLVLRRPPGSGHAFILQNDDGRVVFVIPVRTGLHAGRDHRCAAVRCSRAWSDISPAEIDVPEARVARYFAAPVRDEEIGLELRRYPRAARRRPRQRIPPEPRLRARAGSRAQWCADSVRVWRQAHDLSPAGRAGARAPARGACPDCGPAWTASCAAAWR